MTRFFISFTLIIFIVTIFGIDANAQTVLENDTVIIVSLSVINNRIHCKNDFPEVYPNIDKLKIFTASDTIRCVYDFPFIKLSKTKLAKVFDQDVFMSFDYSLSRKSVTSRYLLTIPIRFSLRYKLAKFIVVKYYGKGIFFSTQSWGSTISTLEKIKAKQIY